MSEFQKILTRKNSLRKNCAELSAEQLNKVIADLTELVEEKRLEEEKQAQIEAQKAAKIEEIIRIMKEGEIDMSELSGLAEYSAKKKVEAKYRLTTEDGEVVEWSGRGRTPAAFKAKFDEGFTKDDFLI